MRTQFTRTPLSAQTSTAPQCRKIECWQRELFFMAKVQAEDCILLPFLCLMSLSLLPSSLETLRCKLQLYMGWDPYAARMNEIPWAKPSSTPSPPPHPLTHLSCLNYSAGASSGVLNYCDSCSAATVPVCDCHSSLLQQLRSCQEVIIQGRQGGL